MTAMTAMTAEKSIPQDAIEHIRESSPLIHHITNYVTVNDCANICLAIGASPVMADALGEAAGIAGIASAVVLNMGTLNERTISSMLAAGKAANEQGIPVVFDPVGVGASALRNETAAEILETVHISVLRGNSSEIRCLSGLASKTRGVDASSEDMGAPSEAASIAQELAGRLNCVVAITGAVDVVSDGTKTVMIENGHAFLQRLTGTGCMCSTLVGSCLGALAYDPFGATLTALLVMGIAGEVAFENAGLAGTGSYRMALHDAVSNMDTQMLKNMARIREV